MTSLRRKCNTLFHSVFIEAITFYFRYQLAVLCTVAAQNPATTTTLPPTPPSSPHSPLPSQPTERCSLLNQILSGLIASQLLGAMEEFLCLRVGTLSVTARRLIVTVHPVQIIRLFTVYSGKDNNPSIFLSLYLYIFLSIYLSIYLSTYLSIYLRDTSSRILEGCFVN